MTRYSAAIILLFLFFYPKIPFFTLPLTPSHHLKLWGSGIFAPNPSYAQETPAEQSLLDEGISLFKARKFNEAIKALHEYSALFPDNYLPYYYIGFSYFRLGVRVSAKEALEKCVELNPDFAPAHMGLGIIYERERKIDLAKKEYEAALYAAKDPGEAKSARDRLNRVKRMLSARHIREARKLVDDGEVKGAIEELSQAMELTPENVAMLVSLGELYIRLLKYNEATEIYLRARKVAPDNPDIRMRLAELYFNVAAYKEAIVEFNEVIRLAPGTEMAEDASGKVREVENKTKTRIYFEKAAKGIREERLDDAIAAMQKVLELEPRNRFAYFNLGVIYNRKKMYEEAIAALTKAIKLSPKYVEAHYQLGVVYDDLGQFNEAIKEYEAAAAVGKDDVEEAKKAAKRLKLLKKLLVTKEVAGRIRILMDAGDLDGALLEAEKIVAVIEDEKNLMTLGQVYLLRKEFDKAIETFGRVIKINLQNWEANLFLGQGYEGKKLYREAEVYYRKIVSAVPETNVGREAGLMMNRVKIKIHFENANEYRKKGDLEGALKETELILELAPDDPVALYNAGVLFNMLEKPEKAILLLTEAKKLRPDYIQAHLQLALVYEGLNRYEEAKAEYQLILSLAKEGSEVDIAKSRLGLLKKEKAFSTHLKAAYRLIQQGKYEEALEEAETVITIVPENYIAHYTIGFIYSGLDMLDEAKAAFQKSIEINPEYTKSHFGLARVYEREGFYEDARNAYRRAKSTGDGTKDGEMAAISLQRLRKWHLQASTGSALNNVISNAGSKSTATSTAYGLSLSYDVHKTRQEGFNVNSSVNYNIYYESQITGMGYGADITWNDHLSELHTYAVSGGYTAYTLDREPNNKRFRYSIKTDLKPKVIPTSISLSYVYSDTTSFVNKVRDVGQHSFSLLTTQKTSKWDSVSANYRFVASLNKYPIGNNFAYRSNSLSLNYTRRLWSAFSVNSGYNIGLKNYTNPDSTTFFRRFRRNSTHAINVGISYRLSNRGQISLTGRSTWETTNIPSLKEEELVELNEILEDPIPRVGGWNNRQTITSIANVSYRLSEMVYLSVRVGNTWGIVDPKDAGGYRKLDVGISVSSAF